MDTTANLNEINKKGKDILDKGYDKSKDVLDKMTDKAQNLDVKSYYDVAKDRGQAAVDASTDFVKKYPLYTVLGAAAIGYLAGWITTRSRE